MPLSLCLRAAEGRGQKSRAQRGRCVACLLVLLEGGCFAAIQQYKLMAGWGDEDDDYSFAGGVGQHPAQTQSAAYRSAMLGGGGNRGGGGYANVFDIDEQDEELYNESYGSQRLNGDGYGYAVTAGGSAPGEMGGDDCDTPMAAGSSTYKRKRRRKLFCVGLLLLIIGGLVVALAIVFSNRATNEGGGSSNNNLGVNNRGAPTATATADPPSSHRQHPRRPLHRIISGTVSGWEQAKTRTRAAEEEMSLRRRRRHSRPWEEEMAGWNQL